MTEDETHAKIMAATGAALAVEGYADLTMRDVARRAPVSKSTLHYRYDTKEGLLTAFLKFNGEQVRAALDALADRPPVERIVGIVELSLTNVADPALADQTLAIVELNAQAARVPAFREVIAADAATLHDHLVAAVEAGIDAGTFRSVDPEAAAHLLATPLDGVALTERVFEQGVVDDLRTALGEILLAGLLAPDVDVSTDWFEHRERVLAAIPTSEGAADDRGEGLP